MDARDLVAKRLKEHRKEEQLLLQDVFVSDGSSLKESDIPDESELDENRRPSLLVGNPDFQNNNDYRKLFERPTEVNPKRFANIQLDTMEDDLDTSNDLVKDQPKTLELVKLGRLKEWNNKTLTVPE